MTSISRTPRISVSLFTALLAVTAFAAGCGDKKAPDTTTSTSAAAATTVTGTPTVATGQGKITSGADPDKAPSYPSMYGKPAGAK